MCEESVGLQAIVALLLRWGADEAAVTDAGDCPSGALTAPSEDKEEAPSEDEDDLPECSPEEVERVITLLARAPVDRAWRRRGWLVMLRSSAEKTGGEHTQHRECKAVEGGIGAATEAGGGWQDQRIGREVGRSGCGAGGPVGRESDSLGIDLGSVALRGVVVMLVGLESEDVFRTVNSFL